MPQIPAPMNLDPNKAATDFAFLLDAFREVLGELGAGDVAAALPWGTPASGAAAGVDQRRLTQALSIAFRLATLAEENASAQHRRHLEDEQGLDSISGLWGRILVDPGGPAQGAVGRLRGAGSGRELPFGSQ